MMFDQRFEENKASINQEYIAKYVAQGLVPDVSLMEFARFKFRELPPKETETIAPATVNPFVDRPSIKIYYEGKIHRIEGIDDKNIKLVDINELRKNFRINLGDMITIGKGIAKELISSKKDYWIIDLIGEDMEVVGIIGEEGVDSEIPVTLRFGDRKIEIDYYILKQHVLPF